MDSVIDTVVSRACRIPELVRLAKPLGAVVVVYKHLSDDRIVSSLPIVIVVWWRIGRRSNLSSGFLLRSERHGGRYELIRLNSV